MERRTKKPIAKNRRAFHEYEILETFEAGIQLTGTEVRSLRENNCQLTDCFALIRGGEVWLHNVHIAPYSNGNIANVDPDRKRKLLRFLQRRKLRPHRTVAEKRTQRRRAGLPFFVSHALGQRIQRPLGQQVGIAHPHADDIDLASSHSAPPIASAPPQARCPHPQAGAR